LAATDLRGRGTSTFPRSNADSELRYLKNEIHQSDVDSRYASLPLGSGFLPRRVSTPMPDSGGRNGRYSSFGAKRPAEDIEAAQSIVGRREQW